MGIDTVDETTEKKRRVIELASSTLTIEQLMDETQATQYICKLCGLANVQASSIEPHIDEIINRAWGLKIARAT